MLKKFSFLLLLIFTFVVSNAQNAIVGTELYGAEASKIMFGAEHVWLKQDNIIPTYMKFRETEAMDERTFLFHLQKQFQLPENYSFKQIGEEKDPLGYTHKRFQILVNNIPVNGGVFILHIHDSKVMMYNGYLFKNVKTPTVPSLSQSDALHFALRNIGATTYKWELPGEEAFLKKEQHDPSATFYPTGSLEIVQENGNSLSTNYILCWKFDIYAHQPMGRYTVFVNAQTGAIVHKQDRICTGDANGTAITAYRGSRPFITDSTSPTNFRLREAARGLGIRTFDLQRGTNYATAIDFLDSNNVWNNINANRDQYATDAHWGAEKTYDFYLSKGRNSIDNAGYQLNLYVHYSTSYLNAFWDGTRMTFGDGSTGYTPLTSLDITGHEISHGLDERTAGLNYSYESGALNESFSDVFGTAVEQYADSVLGNWLIGEDIGSPFRSMSNPNLYSNPDTYLGTYWYTGTADNGGVHTNSGVQNFWYYLLTQGGSGTNDIGSVYNVTGLGRVKSSSIAWRNLTVYLTPTSNYADARFYAIQSAVDLYGPCTPEVTSTTNAWYAVGVGAAYSSVVTASFTNSASVNCAVPYTVTFNNRSTNAGSFIWYFGDGATSTATSPSHTYTTLGTYSVKLVADGGLCGKDSITFTNLVNLSASNPCTVVLPPTGTATTQTSCTGTVYDDGGQFGLYSDNTNSSVTIAPTGATGVTLNFTKFRMENTYDFVYVYNGPSTASPLIGSYTGFTLPASISSTGGSITIRQSSDPSVTDSGFAINWTCTIARPVANFTASPNPACTGQNIIFTNTSTNSPTSYLWSFPGGSPSSSTATNPVVTYPTLGTYTVTLIASNSLGSDTITRLNYITINTGTALPITNGFTSTTFPPTNWSIINTNASTTWARTTAAGRTPTTGNSMMFNNFNIDDRGNNDEVRLPKADLRGFSNVKLVFDVAYAPYNTTFFDGLDVLASSDCGTTFSTLYSKSNTVLATAPATTTIFTPTSLQWRSDTVLLTSYIGQPNVTVSFKNIAGNGQRLFIDNINLFGIPNADFRANDTTICRGTAVTYTNISTGNPTSYSWSFPGGTPSSSTATNPVVTYNTAGLYNVQLIATSASGSDTTVFTNYITVSAPSNATINQSICTGTSYLFNGVNRSTAGTYLDTMLNINGCDSFITLNLTIKSTTAATINQTICAGASYLFNGFNRTTSGTFLDTLTGSNGCDSFLTLNLTVRPTSSGTINQSICAGTSYLFNGINRTTTGTYLDTLVNSALCDSFVTLNLTVRPTSSGTINQSICAGASYLFNGFNRTTSGTFLDT
ncbi:MAG: M4 family metallopeptidase, partial [Bacteroidota bacterium]